MSGINEKAKVHTRAGRRGNLKLEDTAFTQELGFAVIDDENASGKSGSVGNQPSAEPTGAGQGAAEFTSCRKKDGDLPHLAALQRKGRRKRLGLCRLTAAHMQGKNIVGRTTRQCLRLVRASTARRWRRASVTISGLYRAKKGFKMDQLAVTSLRYTPTGIVTALPDKNEVQYYAM